MIPRYSRPEMAAIWSAEHRYRIWLAIERHAAAAMEELGVVPKGVAATLDQAQQSIDAKGGFDVARIDEIERTTKHDVIAFLTYVAEHSGPLSRFVHQGMTSSDVLDTCFAVQLKRGGRPAAGRPRQGAGGARAPRARAPPDADHRPQPRHPRRADHLRPEARDALGRLRPRQEAPAGRARGDRHRRDLRRRRHLRQRRPARRGSASPRRSA